MPKLVVEDSTRQFRVHEGIARPLVANCVAVLSHLGGAVIDEATARQWLFHDCLVPEAR